MGNTPPRTYASKKMGKTSMQRTMAKLYICGPEVKKTLAHEEYLR